MKRRVLMVLLAAAALATPARAASGVIELSCHERLTWGYYSYNGNHFANENDPRTVRYTIDLDRKRWKSSVWQEEWAPFDRTTETEIYLISNGARQVILRRADLQIIEVEPQEHVELRTEYGVAIRESQCRRLPEGRKR
ncbi:MAG: hypothetical protein JWR84_3563 [Caulobacter sp.]|nr:hypothetical protein [Caulobacter sp.]